MSNTGHWNTGDQNTGHWNTGDQNTGHRNTGHRNTGDRNTGHQNTGHWNTGDRNTGDQNTGHWNTGHWNTGDQNTGNWNTCNRETGFFNTEHSETIRVFNRPCSLEEWEKARKPAFLFFLLTEWIQEDCMSTSEKEAHPEYETTGGYLRKYSYKEAFQSAWEKASLEDRELVTKLPNFDPDIFYEISGIRIGDRDGEEACN